MRLGCCFLLCLIAICLAAFDPDTTPLNAYPFVEAHDSASGYLQTGNIFKKIIYDWTKTQPGSVTMQLDCGARSLEFRPTNDSGTLIFHHGNVHIPAKFSDVLKEIVAWAAKNKNGSNDLVLLRTWACEGFGCENMTREAYKKAGIYLVDSCQHLFNMTVGDALRAGALPTGGAVMADLNCIGGPPGWTLYNDQLQCLGFLNTTQGDKFHNELMKCVLDQEPKNFLLSHPPLLSIDWTRLVACAASFVGILDSPAHYTCYRGSSHVDYPFSRLLAWDANVTSILPPRPPNGALFSIQGAWAENVENIVLGFLHGSSLLKDEQQSGLNARITEWVKAGKFKYIPSIGINNVCDGGRDLLNALRAQFH